MSLYLERNIDDMNMLISYASREMHPLVAKLNSILHIARAHPDDALKRAKSITNVYESKKKAEKEKEGQTKSRRHGY